MKTIRPRSSYDIVRSSAWEGPYRATSRTLNKMAGVALAIFVGVALAALAIVELSK